MKKIYLTSFFILFTLLGEAQSNSVARQWNEVQLHAIREDFVRVPVQARNLFHTAIAMYDAWSIYDGTAKPFLMGNSYAGTSYPLGTVASVSDTLAAQEEAMSYAVYRVLSHRYAISPNALFSQYRFDTLMQGLGYNINYTNINYQTGSPADLGNYIGQQIINMGYTDSSNEANGHVYINYTPSNPFLEVDSTGNPNMTNPNSWQPLFIVGALDQSGNPLTSGQIFDAPEWGRVTPFSLQSTQKTVYFKNGGTYPVYFDPGPPPMLDTVNVNDSSSALFKWGHTMVSIWSSQLDPTDTTTKDVGPHGYGNVPLSYLPVAQHQNYYQYIAGGDTSTGYSVNPITNQPYAANITNLGDYGRVVSQFWADGPTSETPPGHWFTLLNYVGDHNSFEKKYEGIGPILDDLEWDVKTYLTLGGAMHDCAISAWGAKGWYDSPRPISAIRKMARYGQSSDSTKPSYHPGGITLVTNFIELIDSNDVLVGANYENLNKIKLKAWAGFDSIGNPNTSYAGVDWILADNWVPYQRKSFVSPPFAGYVSGHSTYSRGAAEVLTALTGSPYFPDGLGEYVFEPGNSVLFFENGPSDTVKLQWATYRDASNEASLSRIWGGIHPPFDDMYGRVAGETVGVQSHDLAKSFFLGAPLPIHLASFHQSIRNCTVTLNWKTLSEENSNRFEIWHGNNGIDFTNKIGEVNSAGNSTSEKDYTFLHQAKEAINYYKLVEVDINNEVSTSAFSPKVLVDCFNKPITFSVYPNPSFDEINIALNAQNDAIDNIEICDLSGKVVKKIPMADTQTMTTKVSIGSLAQGNYKLIIRTIEGQKEVKLFEKK